MHRCHETKPPPPSFCCRVAWFTFQVFLFLSAQLSFQRKVGILYCQAGQGSEEDMYNNEEASPTFREFLDLLGERVRLRGFEKYRAQLDTKSKCRRSGRVWDISGSLPRGAEGFPKGRTASKSRRLVHPFLIQLARAVWNVGKRKSRSHVFFKKKRHL